MTGDAEDDRHYILVTEGDPEDVVEVPLEDDGTLLLSTLAGQFQGASGLRYKSQDMRAYRALRIDEGRIHPPPDGWSDGTYHVVFPKGKPENAKRKMDDGYWEEERSRSPGGPGGVASANYPSKYKRVEQRRCMDLIVLGLNYSTTEDGLKDYFTTFGNVIVAEIKRDVAGKSKGFGFIRFDDYDAQVRAMSERHRIDGKMCDAKIPNSKLEGSNEVSRKVFVGRVPSSMAPEDLRSYFSKYGNVTDIYIPNPHRAFAFVTFDSCEAARTVLTLGTEHIIQGHSVTVGEAAPKGEKTKESQIEKIIAQQTAFWGPGGPETFGSGRMGSNPIPPVNSGPQMSSGPMGVSQGAMGGFNYGGSAATQSMMGGAQQGGMASMGQTAMGAQGFQTSGYPQQMMGGYSAQTAQMGYGGYGGMNYNQGYNYNRMVNAQSQMTMGAPPQQRLSAGTNQATYGMSNLNLDSVNPQMYAAAHAALMSVMQSAGGHPAGGAAPKPGPIGAGKVQGIQQENPSVSKVDRESPVGIGGFDWGRSDERYDPYWKSHGHSHGH